MARRGNLPARDCEEGQIAVPAYSARPYIRNEYIVPLWREGEAANARSPKASTESRQRSIKWLASNSRIIELSDTEFGNFNLDGIHLVPQSSFTRANLENGSLGIWRFLYGRDCKGSRMRATVKFAVICVSLLIAAHADAVDRRNQIKALDFQEHGALLRLELERAYQDLRRTGEFKAAGNDVSSIVKKYVPVGTSFANAETTLRSAGFNMDPLPPREPPKDPSPLWSDQRKLMMRFAIFGTLVLAQHGVSTITVEITLLPKISGADHNTVKGVHAAIYYRGV
jgi:hypothetical protein